MNEFLAGAVLIVLFGVRFAMPLIVTISIGYALSQLEKKWSEEQDRLATTT